MFLSVLTPFSPAVAPGCQAFPAPAGEFSHATINIGYHASSRVSRTKCKMQVPGVGGQVAGAWGSDIVSAPAKRRHRALQCRSCVIPACF